MPRCAKKKKQRDYILFSPADFDEARREPYLGRPYGTVTLTPQASSPQPVIMYGNNGDYAYYRLVGSDVDGAAVYEGVTWEDSRSQFENEE